MLNAVNGTTPFPSGRIVAGYDFIGDAFNGGNTPVEDSNPEDCNGHGTHVAGIVGANGGGIKGVASYGNAQRSFIVNDVAPYGFNAALGAPLPPTPGTPLTMERTGTTTTTNDACAVLPAGSLTGRAVLIRRGTCSFYVKARNAQIAGASAVVLYQ